MTDLFKEASIIEQRAAECECVAAYGENLGEHEGRVEKALRLASGDLSGAIHPSRGVDGAVERRVLGVKAAAIPNDRREKNHAGQKLLRTGHESNRMAGHFRRKAAQSRGD